ncbi:MAG TPA: hypothetical protein VGN20_04185 [Mucilaginibacter sp.]|jgi:hypothetical protein
MKSLPFVLVFAAICLTISCKKEKQQPIPQPPGASARTIRFILYTNQDFSNDDDTISFLLTIRSNTGTINSRTIFDSTLTTIKIKDIPGPSNKLVFEKKIPNDDGSILTAGFVYTTRFGVGWSLDTCGANQKLKVIEYPFR